MCFVPTVVQQPLHVQEDVGEGGQLLLVLEQLREVVGDALRVAHVVVVVEAAVARLLLRLLWLLVIVSVSLLIVAAAHDSNGAG